MSNRIWTTWWCGMSPTVSPWIFLIVLYFSFPTPTFVFAFLASFTISLLNPQTTIRDLSFTFNRDLSPVKYIEDIFARRLRYIGLFLRSSSEFQLLLPLKTLYTVFEYGRILWNPFIACTCSASQLIDSTSLILLITHLFYMPLIFLCKLTVDKCLIYHFLFTFMPHQFQSPFPYAYHSLLYSFHTTHPFSNFLDNSPIVRLTRTANSSPYFLRKS